MRTLEAVESGYAKPLVSECPVFSALPGHAPVMQRVAWQNALETARWSGDLVNVAALTLKLEGHDEYDVYQ